MSSILSDRPGSAAARPAGAPAIVAIPANDEAERIGTCLAALAVQRDRFGAPLPTGSFGILVFANNCRDDTVAVIEHASHTIPHPVTVVSERLPPETSNAGWARKRAMDIAADTLSGAGHPSGLILTTDADSAVGPTWVDATTRAIADGADAVAGYVDAHPHEIIPLGRSFLRRSRLEDRYLSIAAEIYARCDPRAHDPWPNHRVSSGASLAVTLAAYQAIGGLPPKPVGEDGALTLALENAGFRVRHSMEVCVSTSCRVTGRARGGAADTIRHRRDVLDAPCNGDLEPAFAMVRRALYKGRLRASHEGRRPLGRGWGVRIGLSDHEADILAAAGRGAGFETFWSSVERASPALAHRRLLRPDDLPHQIDRAALCLGALRKWSSKRFAIEPAAQPFGMGATASRPGDEAPALHAAFSLA